VVISYRESSGMGWLRLVGSLKVQVSFAEYSFFNRALLQKRPIMLRSLLIVATPYQVGGSHSEKERKTRATACETVYQAERVRGYFRERT